MTRGVAAAKLNLALVVGPPRDDGKHEVATVYQRVALADRIELHVSDDTSVDGFASDTLVREALERLTARDRTRIAARIDKRIPVAAGLGGGSADAAAVLRLANGLLAQPLSAACLHDLAAGLGADVPFFLRDGPHLGTGDGSELQPIELPQDYWVLLVLPNDRTKESTAAVYERFDRRRGADGFPDRRAALLHALSQLRRAQDLATLPLNDLASSPLANELLERGAFRADVTGAGPAVYGLFLHRATAEAARRAIRRRGRTWITAPAWYV